jgi:hypothetical protein
MVTRSAAFSSLVCTLWCPRVVAAFSLCGCGGTENGMEEELDYNQRVQHLVDYFWERVSASCACAALGPSSRFGFSLSLACCRVAHAAIAVRDARAHRDRLLL